MAKIFKNETKLFTENAPKRITYKGNRTLNEWIAAVFFIFVLLPVYADISPEMENVIQHSSDEFLKYEIIKPTLQHSRNNRVIFDTRLEDGSHVDELTLQFAYDKKDVILDLKLNLNLIPHNHFLRYQRPNGSDVVQYYNETDIDLCHYKGTIRKNAASFAAISTCYGIKGVISDGTEIYYIETKHNGNISDEHFLFRHSDRKQNQLRDLTCANHQNEGIEPPKLTYDPIVTHRSKRSADEIIRGPTNANRQSSFVELVLVVDNSIYRNLDRDFKKIHHYCKEIANIVNALYVPLNIFVILVGVSVWNEKDRIHLSSDSTETLENFLRHRREVLLLEHPNDNAHLLTNQKFDRRVIGHAPLNGICTYKNSGGITNNHSVSNSVVASTVAHELGHNFGMGHDTKTCKCDKEPCIMADTNTKVAAFHWSSCSKDQLNVASRRGLLQCLRNKPTQLIINSECGNGFVEPGEQCDCGLPEFCDNSCCDANTCKLHLNASCATGECCDLNTCRLHVPMTLCRSKEGECDLPEYCTGESEYCPENRFKRDTELCGGGKAYCYEGACQSHTDQCKLLWGPSGMSVDQCYNNNMRGDARGNCGKNWMKNSLEKCSKQDVMCGQLQCKPLNDSNELEKSSSVEIMRGYSPNYPYFQCQAAIIDVGVNNVDPGLSPNGAICGEGKMCLQQKCLSLESIRARGVGVTCPEDCNGHGTCDNKGDCHCYHGYLPPLCNLFPLEWSDNGPATSLNDGVLFVRIMYLIFIGVVCQLF